MLWPVNKTDHMLQGINATHEFISCCIDVGQTSYHEDMEHTGIGDTKGADMDLHVIWKFP